MNENAKTEETAPACKRCGQPAQEYSPGNHSVQCKECNEVAATKRRAASARRRAGTVTERTERRALAACRPPPKWTQQKPTEPGRYWVKCEGFSPCVKNFTHRQHDGRLEPVSGPLSTAGWHWFSGPIPEPKH